MDELAKFGTELLAQRGKMKDERCINSFGLGN